MTDEERATYLHDNLCHCERGADKRWIIWASLLTDEEAAAEVAGRIR